MHKMRSNFSSAVEWPLHYSCHQKALWNRKGKGLIQNLILTHTCSLRFLLDPWDLSLLVTPCGSDACFISTRSHVFSIVNPILQNSLLVGVRYMTWSRRSSVLHSVFVTPTPHSEKKIFQTGTLYDNRLHTDLSQESFQFRNRIKFAFYFI